MYQFCVRHDLPGEPATVVLPKGYCLIRSGISSSGETVAVFILHQAQEATEAEGIPVKHGHSKCLSCDATHCHHGATEAHRGSSLPVTCSHPTHHLTHHSGVTVSSSSTTSSISTTSSTISTSKIPSLTPVKTQPSSSDTSTKEFVDLPSSSSSTHHRHSPPSIRIISPTTSVESSASTSSPSPPYADTITRSASVETMDQSPSSTSFIVSSPLLSKPSPADRSLSSTLYTIPQISAPEFSSSQSSSTKEVPSSSLPETPSTSKSPSLTTTSVTTIPPKSSSDAQLPIVSIPSRPAHEGPRKSPATSMTEITSTEHLHPSRGATVEVKLCIHYHVVIRGRQKKI